MAVVVWTGCGPSAGPHLPPPASERGTATGSAGATAGGQVPPAPTPSPDTRPELVLRANLSDRPGRLTAVARIPFGEGVARVGLINDPHHADRPIFPASFTVAPDGSFWLVDEVKHRLAHVDPTGRYLGQIGGLRFDRFHPQPQDVVAAGDSLYLLEQDHQHFLLSYLRQYRDSSLVASALLDDGTDPQIVARLVSGAEPVIGLSGGLAGDAMDMGQGRRGYAELSVGRSPTVRPVDGIPLDHGLAVAGAFDPNRPDDRYLLSAMRPESTAIFPLRFVATLTGSENAKTLPTGAGFQMQAVLGDRVAVWVQVSPSRTVDAERYGGGVWLLVFPLDGSPLIWQRLPAPGLSSEGQVRTLAAGPDGSLFVMLVARDAMVIYRVPGT
jgi:hypothetical protein